MDRRFLRAALIGAAAAFVLFFGLLTFGRGGLLAEDQLGGFYEAQTRAIFDGHLWVDPGAVSFEGFSVGERVYIYQGPVPALLRMPVMAVTSRFDGRMTRVSMLLAYLVSLAAIVRIGWRLRVLVRGDAAVDKLESAWTGIAVFSAGASTLLFLGAKPWVYHEALLWGAALALASFAALVRWLLEPGRGWRGVAWAGLLAGAALLTRPSVGLGPVLALGLVGLRELVALRRPAARSRAAWQRIAGLALAALLPLVAYAAINQAKFGSPFKLPTDAQVLVSFDKERQAALEANGGSLFGAQFAPSVLWQAVRPDAVGFQREFPFVSFPTQRPDALGDVVFAERDWSSSVPVSEPMLVLLGVVGVVALVVPDRLAAGSRARLLRMPVLGAAAAGAGVLVLGYMANRYLSDVLPLLVLTGFLGSAIAVRWVSGRTRLWRRASLVGLGLLALWGGVVNTSLGLEYQREIAPGAPGRSRAEWLVWQTRLGPNPGFVRLSATDPLPPGDHVGRIAVVGRCQGLYRSTGGDWQPVEARPGVGHFDLEVSTSAPVSGGVPLVAGVGPIGHVKVGLAVTDGIAVPNLDYQMPGTTLLRHEEGAGFPFGPGKRRHLQITLDWRIGYIEFRDVDADEVVYAYVLPLPHVPMRIVAQPPVRATQLAPDIRACRALGAN